MCWALIVEVCLSGIIIIENKGGKHEHKRTERNVPKERGHDGDNADGSV